MRPTEIVKERRLDFQPCLFSGAANPSDVCQVLHFAAGNCYLSVSLVQTTDTYYHLYIS